ncbi:PAP2 superfamily protein [Tenacibaculum sp. 190524A02b]|uniref:Undecaprenyl-diphosphatase n=1 Tax=Tenacibaculum vairaonense TaxID=3137860 RepID=A0ABP1FFV5_9FLAO
MNGDKTLIEGEHKVKKLSIIKKVVASLLSSIKKETFIIYGLFFMVSLVLIFIYDKLSLHQIMNQYHNSFFDTFFKYITHVGDGVMFGVLVIAFFFIKRKMALVFLVSGILTLLVTHLFKKIIFKGIPRPVGALGEEALHLIEGVKMALMNSFPSGHTTTAFAIFTILCLYHSKNKLQYAWIFLAILAGFSRVYLSQHFLIDILVGSFLGIIIGFISMSLFYSSLKK